MSANVSVSHSKCLYIYFKRLSLKSKEDLVIVYKNILHVSHLYHIDNWVSKERQWPNDLSSVADSEGLEGTFAPPPLKSAKKRKRVLISLFFHSWWLKMQKFLGSLRSPVLFNNINKA